MNLETLAIILTSLGVGGLLKQVITGVAKWWSGAQSRERDQARWMIEQRDDCEHRAARLRRERDRWREVAMRQRLQLIQAGIDPGKLPTCTD